MTEPPRKPPEGFESFEALGDIFADFFSKTGKHGSTDVSMPLALSLHEAAHGCTREVEVPRTRVCSLCEGTGGARSAQFTSCAACAGRGETRSKHGALEVANVCETCGGRRGRWSVPCSACDAMGRVSDTPTRMNVTVPPGVRPGQTLRLEGQGDRPHLFLRLDVELPEGLSIEGDHLVARVRLDAGRAARGGTLTVPWIDGSARVVVPPRTEHGARLVKRAWGLSPLNTPFSPPPAEGVPYRSGEAGQRGDLIVVITIGTDPDALLEAELAAMPPSAPPTRRLNRAKVRAASISLAIVAVVIGYLLVSR